MSHSSAILSLLSKADEGSAPDREIPEARPVTSPDGSVTGWTYPDTDLPGDSITYDMNELASTGPIGRAVVSTFALVHPATQAKLTIATAHRALKTALLPFLQMPANHDAPVDRVDRDFLYAFRDDLDRRYGHTKTWTRSQAFLSCQAHLRATAGHPDVDWIDAPYPEAHLDLEPVPPVDLDDMMTILDAAITDTETTMAREAALGDPAHPLWTAPDRVHLEAALLLRKLYPSAPPERTVLQSSADARLRSIAWHGYTQALTYGYPTVERLAAFAILLLFLFRLNSSDMQRLRQRSIEWPITLGIERVAVTYLKRRSHRVLSPSFPVDEGPGNPARLIRFLEGWTAPLREELAPRLAGRVMIAAALKTTKKRDRVIGLEGKTFENRIDRFCVGAGVPDVTASKIRKSALRLVDTLTGGDPLVRMAAGGHRSRQTSERHYPGDADQQDEAMAHGFTIAHDYMLGHQRDHPKSRTPDEDALCITPGWDCANPLLGILPGERAGRRCRAYGRCPGCPLGSPDLSSPLSYARSKALLAEIQRAEHRMNHNYWIGTWRPIEVRLRTVWLLRFTTDARVRGEMIEAPMMEIRDERHG